MRDVLHRWLLPLLVLALLSGCGGGQPVTLADIPIPPGLERYEGAAETTLDSMLAVANQAQARPGAPPQIDYRWLPRPQSWQSVEAFYTAELGAEWQRAAAPALPQGGRWTRTAGGASQVLVVSVVDIGVPAGAVLVIALADA